MKLVHNPLEAFAHVDHWRRDGMRIGLVPTMGALHDGHLSLVRRSASENDVSVVSVFVNPTQFGPHEDFSRYPRTLESDLIALRQCKVDMVFAPTIDHMYPKGFATFVLPGAIGQILEGASRPDHFRGVLTVVLKLFSILPAHIAYFGQKDYQQFLVIRRMVEDLNLAIRTQCCETVREPDGLAMSSRNRYLKPAHRHQALSLSKALHAVDAMAKQGVTNIVQLEDALRGKLYEEGADRVDYARIVDLDTLDTLQVLGDSSIALVAAYVGPTRLIDNLML